ncbi:hypothetical protein NDU88_002805 [Pleurodeles waltl]|uniref:YEATS domain-containing protein 2 n=1 Tax=Pleurodeles waltl TaxID=8319 RepID=A0AAV7LDH2_PLEWA|nr:hypothetical protein NDU88_002805 [Pleurodeles waltl]
MGENVQEQVIKAVRESPFFSIAMDESTDIGDVGQLLVWVSNNHFLLNPTRILKNCLSTARDAAVQKIEEIIKEQFADEMKNKEHEIEVINQRLLDARRMMDKLRACIVANYYASAGLPKIQEGPRLCDQMAFNHPSIKKFLECPLQPSSPVNHSFESLSASYSETDPLSQNNDLFLSKESNNLEMRERFSNAMEQRPGRHSRQDSEGAQIFAKVVKRNTSFKAGDDPSRLYVKKTIVVGNVSKYIPPDKREENDQSTHKWMVYVRGSQKEPSIHHFVKKVWFFLHPSYKPNDLVEVSEPPFHLTRRGWGEFPVRVQIHFKDSQNKRVDIIHNLKLDRTYTGLQNLGAETVVDVELHRHSFGEDYLFSQSSESVYSNSSAPLAVSSPVKTSSTIQQVHKPITSLPVTKGFFIRSRDEQPTTTFHSPQSALEHSPTKIAPPKIKFGSHGNSAFQPITASCKIIPPGQLPSAAESPGKSFQPITMSCKIVSGSPTSKHLNVTLAGRGSGSPGPKIHSSSFLTSSVKPEDSLFASMPPLGPIGSHTKLQSAKTVTEGLGTFTKVLIKQESGEPHYPSLVTSTSSQPALQQYVSVKGNHIISMSPQKPLVNVSEVPSTPGKVLGVPLSSAAQSSMKPAMAISGGQILVAKSVSSVGKVTGQKPVVAQGVAKAIVSSGGSSIVAQPVQTITKAPALSSGAQKAASQGSVMATLQLPATNLSNLANLPPGTKLYLTTNSKNPSGKGKLLLIPQGAILRATNNASLQSSSSGSTAGGTQGTNSGLSQHLSFTSYILKQTPQGTFLVGQTSAQNAAKQEAQNALVQGGVGPGTSTTHTQSSLKVVSGQKTTILGQGAGGQTALTKISENLLKSAAAPHVLSRGGTTMLRLTGGVITAATSTAVNGVAPQVDAAHSIASSAAPSTFKAFGQHILVNQVQSGAPAASKPGMATVVSASSLISAASVVSGRASTPGLLKIHSNQSSSQKAVLTIPTSQMKHLGGTTASAEVQTMLIPVNKVVQSGSTCKQPAAPAESTCSTLVPHPAHTTVTKVKTEPEMTVSSNNNTCAGSLNSAIVKTEEIHDLNNYCISTEYLDNSQQLLTTVVKMIPLLTEKSEEAEPFCAKSVEQYYSWNIGKRRAAEWQRAVRVRKTLHDVAEKNHKFNSVSLLTTKHVLYWCRHHGYTPPDLESLRDKEESIEDVLTQIDSEPECPSSYSTAESLCRKLEDLQQILKKEPELDEEVDIVKVNEPLKADIKKEQQEKDEEVKFYLEPTPAIDFVSNTAQKVHARQSFGGEVVKLCEFVTGTRGYDLRY